MTLVCLNRIRLDTLDTRIRFLDTFIHSYKGQHFPVADILGLCWLSDSFIVVILDTVALKDDSFYLFAVVKLSGVSSHEP